MSRSSNGFAGSIGAALAGFLLAGCGTTLNSSVIGAPAQANHVGVLLSTDAQITQFQQALARQLSQAETGGSSGLDLSLETNALASNATLKTAERLDALRSAGLTTATSLETTLQALIAATTADTKLDSVSVDSRAVGPTVLALLSTAEAQVEGLAGAIAADTLVDVLRTDNVALASLRVHGFIDQQAHLLIAAGDTLYEANSLGQTSQQLWGLISGGVGAADPNYGAELNAWNQLRAAIDTTSSTAATAVRVALSLTSAGFPGNQGTLTSQHDSLAQTPNGSLNTARTSIAQIRTLLALRHQ